MSSPTNSALFMWRRGRSMDMRVGSALVRCFFWTPSTPWPTFLHPESLQRGLADGPLLLVVPSANTTITNTTKDFRMGQSRNKRAAGAS